MLESVLGWNARLRQNPPQELHITVNWFTTSFNCWLSWEVAKIIQNHIIFTEKHCPTKTARYSIIATHIILLGNLSKVKLQMLLWFSRIFKLFQWSSVSSAILVMPVLEKAWPAHDHAGLPHSLWNAHCSEIQTDWQIAETTYNILYNCSASIWGWPSFRGPTIQQCARLTFVYRLMVGQLTMVAYRRSQTKERTSNDQ